MRELKRLLRSGAGTCCSVTSDRALVDARREQLCRAAFFPPTDVICTRIPPLRPPLPQLPAQTARLWTGRTSTGATAILILHTEVTGTCKLESFKPLNYSNWECWIPMRGALAPKGPSPRVHGLPLLFGRHCGHRRRNRSERNKCKTD